MSAHGQDLDAWRAGEKSINAILMVALKDATTEAEQRDAGNAVRDRIHELALNTVLCLADFEIAMAFEWTHLHRDLSASAQEWLDAGKELRRPVEVSEQLAEVEG